MDEETRQSFRFESQVENVFKNDSGQYQVVTSNSETEEEFDQVIVATGHFDKPLRAFSKSVRGSVQKRGDRVSFEELG